MKIARLDRPSDMTMRIVIAVVLVVFAVASRLVPHPDNVAPIAAIALFGGALLPRRWALSLPLVAMIVSDLFIGLHSLVFFTWGSFVLIALGSSYLLKRIRPLNVMAASLGASVLFYAVTNLGVWLQGTMYAMTPQGLVQCYVNALPFFRNTLVGDILFSTALFGAYALAMRYATTAAARRTAKSPQP